tara:strand:+ start:1641 stop:2567 length:927 start_codon:yes stop_codon:yes gene_type:complete
MANERHTDARGWEIDFSTRQSVHPYTRYSPFRAATSTSVSTLFTVDRGETATNWVTNPRVEAADITMFTATGSAISRSTAQQSLGAASLLVNPDNSAADEGVYWTSPVIPFSINPQHLTVQIEHRGASASGAVTLEIMDADGSILATSGTDNLATSWRRLTAQYTIAGSTTAAAYRLSVTTTAQHNIDFYVDKIMFEVREDTTAVSTYIDGDNGIDHSWTGTASASTSLKKPGLALIRGITLKNESGTAADIVYVAFDTIASSTTGIAVLGGGTLETNWPLGFTNKITVIAAQNTPTVSGTVWGTHYV